MLKKGNIQNSVGALFHESLLSIANVNFFANLNLLDITSQIRCVHLIKATSCLPFKNNVKRCQPQPYLQCSSGKAPEMQMPGSLCTFVSILLVEAYSTLTFSRNYPWQKWWWCYLNMSETICQSRVALPAPYVVPVLTAQGIELFSADILLSWSIYVVSNSHLTILYEIQWPLLLSWSTVV